MRRNRQNILVTRPLSDKQIAYAHTLGLEPIIESAIEIQFSNTDDETCQVINNHPQAAWVFTSTNGVEAIEKQLNSGLLISPPEKVFAVGNKTAEALERHGMDAKVPATQDGKHLAKLIIGEEVKSVLYFHGSLSRDEMTNILCDHEIIVIEQEVYQTHIQAVTMPAKPLGGILFYSPSAVEGFVRGIDFDCELPPLFAIGPTTAGALKEQTDRPVHIADQPDTKVLLQTVADYIYEKMSDAPKEFHS